MYNVGLPHIMCVGLYPMQLSRAWRFRYLGWIDIYIYITYLMYMIYIYYIIYTYHIHVYTYIYILYYHFISSFKHGTWQLIHFWRFHGTLFWSAPKAVSPALVRLRGVTVDPTRYNSPKAVLHMAKSMGALDSSQENHGNFRQKDVMKNAKEINFN